MKAGHWAGLLGLLLGVLALGPGLGPGFILIGDMVFTPDPSISAFTFGLDGTVPRHVPSETLVTLLSQVIPAQAVQKGVLLAIFVIGCTGAARLVPGYAGLVAGAFYVWNPYVAERLLIGHWALLLGYAGLPWVVHAAMTGRAKRLLVALLPAAAGGFAAMLITLPVAVLAAAIPFRRGADVTPDPHGAAPYGWRGAGTAFACWLLLSLPWVIPALVTGPPASDPAGADAFAPRSDTPFGVIGSLLSLGGIWNAEAVPTGYSAVAFASLILVITGVAAAVGYGGRNGLMIAAAVGLGIALVGAAGPGVLRWAIGVWAGFAVLRDAQQYIAPLALLAAVGLGLLMERLAAHMGRMVTIVGLLVPLAVLPSLAWGAYGRLEAVEYPASWARARTMMQAPGDVVVLPFEAYRRYPWNNHRPVLDAAQRYFSAPGRRVVINDTLLVDEYQIAAEDPKVVAAARILDGENAAKRLCAAGFRYAVVDGETRHIQEGAADTLRGARLLQAQITLSLYDLCP